MAYLTTTQGGQPVLILKEDTTRRRGMDAQRNNMMAARIIAEAVKTTLGPRGMDKMLVDGFGDITITNDGATILDEIDVEHPAAKMMVEVAKTQDDMVGDGTTTAVVLAGELLRKAEELLEQGIHQTVIVSGYRKAFKVAVETLNKVGIPVDLDDHETLKKVALTSLASKAVGGAREHLAEIAVDAAKKVAEQRGDRNVVDIDDVHIVKKEGKSLLDTQLIQGMIVNKEVIHANMPKRLENVKVALIDVPLEIEKTEITAEIRIRDPTLMQGFREQETRMLREMVRKIKDTGANVALCQKGIADLAQHFLAKEGIMAARRVLQSEMKKIARATGGTIINNLDDLQPEDLGEAGLVEERRIGEDRLIFIEHCKNPRSVAILIRAGLERMVDEAERAMNDALNVVADVIEHNKIVAGGGAVEIGVAKEIREYSVTVGGREQLAIEAFAESLEIVPKVLAENAGLDPLDILVAVRSAHEKPKGNTMGVDVFTGKVIDMYKAGVLEPVRVKEQAIKSAAEISSMILRIDDVIAARKTEPTAPPSGMPEGY